MLQGAGGPETTAGESIGGWLHLDDTYFCSEEESAAETKLITAEWDEVNKDPCTLLYRIVDIAGGAPIGLTRKFKSQVLTGGDGLDAFDGDSPNRDTTKAKGVTQQYIARCDDNDKWCLLQRTKT